MSAAARFAISKKGRSLFWSGYRNPCFTTDVRLPSRDGNIQAILKATKVDGVYDSDPATNPNAKRFETLEHSEVLQHQLNVMDSTAIAMCRDNQMPIIVFNLCKGNIRRAVLGEKVVPWWCSRPPAPPVSGI